MAREAPVQAEIMLEAPRMDARLLRNNVGAWQDKQGNWVHYGVGGNGGADTIGLTTIRITSQMVGLDIAVFTAVECKAKGRTASDEQKAFLAMVKARGGIACLAYTVEDFKEAVDVFKSRRAAR